ncbi:synaptic vesicle transporter [Aureobasidium pullulans]|uniref:Cercosporin MFS transporter CTB4 n=1 Tax=Aureobasidium pullulans TaxID=5580 RepID=A0A4S9A355_AURPU|nr:synaptic vesicle transporter [Aureobasidium pullulans]
MLHIFTTVSVYLSLVMSEKSTDSDLERGSHVQPPQHHHGPSVSWFRLVYDQALVTPEVQNWRYAGSGTEEDPFVVVWIDNDPRNPMTWPDWQKWCLVALVSIATLAVAFVSSAYTGGLSEVIVQFQTSQLIVTLGVSLFVLGFAIGPLILKTNVYLQNADGIIADMFDPDQRGLAMTFFASAPFLGPVIGPIVGGFAGETIGWRWVEGIMAIFTGILWIAGSLLIPETYAPVLLRKRARALEETNPGKIYKTRAEIASGPVQFVSVFSAALIRPWKLLFGEPIVLLLSIYMAIIYGTLYLMFAAFPIVYQQKRGWSPGIGGLAFLGVAVGMLFAIVYCLWDNQRYKRVAAANNGNAPPEARLPMSMVGACALPIGFFWFAWTNSPSVHWMASIAAGAPFGFGMILVFLGVMNYLIDAYTIYAASALAANSVLRSLFGMAFPLFTSYLYANLGIHWASCIPAFLALMCLPMPVSDIFFASSSWGRITDIRGSADFWTM